YRGSTCLGDGILLDRVSLRHLGAERRWRRRPAQGNWRRAAVEWARDHGPYVSPGKSGTDRRRRMGRQLIPGGDNGKRGSRHPGPRHTKLAKMAAEQALGQRRIPRLADVAEAAKVSAATVSRVLNSSPSVDPVLADRVRVAAARLGYRPNAIARNLRRRGT